MFVEWFSQKMVGPLFVSSFDSSTVRAGRNSTNNNGRTPSQPWHHTAHATMMTTTHSTHAGPAPARSTYKAVTTCRESARPHANSKKTKQHSSTNARHSMRSAGCAACQSTTTQSRTPQMTASTSITCSRSASIPNFSSTRQASGQVTPAATGSEATKTHPRQSAHSQDNG